MAKKYEFVIEYECPRHIAIHKYRDSYITTSKYNALRQFRTKHKDYLFGGKYDESSDYIDCYEVVGQYEVS